MVGCLAFPHVGLSGRSCDTPASYGEPGFADSANRPDHFLQCTPLLPQQSKALKMNSPTYDNYLLNRYLALRLRIADLYIVDRGLTRSRAISQTPSNLSLFSTPF